MHREFATKCLQCKTLTLQEGEESRGVSSVNTSGGTGYGSIGPRSGSGTGLSMTGLNSDHDELDALRRYFILFFYFTVCHCGYRYLTLIKPVGLHGSDGCGMGRFRELRVEEREKKLPAIVRLSSPNPDK